MKLLKKCSFDTILTFALITYLSSALMIWMKNMTYVLTFQTLSRILIFSLILGLAGLLLEIKKVPKSILRFFHFAILCADFSLILATLPYKGDFKMNLASTLIFAIIYWIARGISALICAIITFTKSKENNYKNVILK